MRWLLLLLSPREPEGRPLSSSICGDSLLPASEPSRAGRPAFPHSPLRSLLSSCAEKTERVVHARLCISVVPSFLQPGRKSASRLCAWKQLSVFCVLFVRRYSNAHFHGLGIPLCDSSSSSRFRCVSSAVGIGIPLPTCPQPNLLGLATGLPIMHPRNYLLPISSSLRITLFLFLPVVTPCRVLLLQTLSPSSSLSLFFLLLPIQPFVSSPSSLPPPLSFPSLLCFHQIQVLSFGVMISPTHSILFLPSNSILFSSHQFNPLLFLPTNPTSLQFNPLPSLPPMQPSSFPPTNPTSLQCNPLLFLPTHSILSSLPPIQSSLLSKHSPFVITNTSQTKLSSC